MLNNYVWNLKYLVVAINFNNLDAYIRLNCYVIRVPQVNSIVLKIR